MRWVIENGELQGILWDGENESGTVRIPEGIRALGQCCLEMDDSPCPPDIEEVIIPGSVRWIDAQAFTSWSMFKPFPHLHTVRYQGTLRDWCGIRKGWSAHFETYLDIGLEDHVLWLLDDEGKEYPAEHLVFPEETEDPELSEALGRFVSWIDDLYSLLQKIHSVEGELWHRHYLCQVPDWWRYTKISQETFLEQFLDTAECLLELCTDCEKELKSAGL